MVHGRSVRRDTDPPPYLSACETRTLVIHDDRRTFSEVTTASPSPMGGGSAVHTLDA
jgi:hypothetical protein